MATKINKELSDEIYSRYLELKKSAKYKKGYITQLLMDQFDLPRTSAWDHSRGREKSDGKFQGKEIEASEVATHPVKEFEIKELPDINYRQYEIGKRYIITTWDIRANISESFIKCLIKLAEHLNAELLLTPSSIEDVKYIPSKLKDIFEIVTHNIKFNDNLKLHYMPTNVLLQSSLAGFRGAFPESSTIIPGAIREVITEPSGVTCKQLLSTGFIGKISARYDDYAGSIHPDNVIEFSKRWNSLSGRSKGKPLALAQIYVKPSALIVDIKDDRTFLSRYVTMEQEGVLYDIDVKITPNKIEHSIPSGLITGDYHVFDMDEKSHVANKEMIKQLNPKEVVVGDFFDGRSVCYHDIGDSVTFSQAPTIAKEAEVTKKALKEITDISNRVVYLHSNHCDFIVKLLNLSENIWRFNGNYADCCELQAYRLKQDRHPIVKLLDLDNIPNLHFSPDREIYKIEDVVVMHGHEVSYGRIGTREIIKRYNKIICQHFHTPEVFRNGCIVGTTSNPDASYATGYNAVMPANALIHADSSIQLLPIIHSKELGTVWR